MSFNKDLVLINGLVIECYLVLFHFRPPPISPDMHLEIRFKNLIFWQGGVTLWKMLKQA